MSGHGSNPLFFNDKKIKIGRPEHLLTPHFLRPITSHFCLTPDPTHPTSNWTSYVYHPSQSIWKIPGCGTKFGQKKN